MRWSCWNTLICSKWINQSITRSIDRSMHLTPWKYLIRYITVRRTRSIIPCRNASCNILRICFNGSEMTTCLINDQINDKRKMSILSEDTLLESGKLFKKNFQSRSLDTCAASSTRCPNFWGLFTSKITWYYTWNLKPKRWIDHKCSASCDVQEPTSASISLWSHSGDARALVGPIQARRSSLS